MTLAALCALAIAVAAAGQSPDAKAPGEDARVAEFLASRLDGLVAQMREAGLSEAGLANYRSRMAAAWRERTPLLRRVDETRRDLSREWSAQEPDPDRIEAAARAAAAQVRDQDHATMVSLFRALSPSDRKVYGKWMATFHSPAALAPQ